MERPLKESLTIEFKSDRKCYALSKLYGDLVGMANTEGGWLFLGIEDDGTVTGVDNQHKNCLFMEANIQDNTMPSLFVKSHMELCRCTANHASWLLRQMVKDEVIKQQGQSRATHYTKK